MSKGLHWGVSARASSTGLKFAMRPGFAAAAPARSCEWIEGDGHLETIRRGENPHCGERSLGGSSYCGPHHRRAYVRQRATRP